MLEDADVVVENNRAGAMERMGLDTRTSKSAGRTSSTLP